MTKEQIVARALGRPGPVTPADVAECLVTRIKPLFDRWLCLEVGSAYTGWSDGRQWVEVPGNGSAAGSRLESLLLAAILHIWRVYEIERSGPSVDRSLR